MSIIIKKMLFNIFTAVYIKVGSGVWRTLFFLLFALECTSLERVLSGVQVGCTLGKQRSQALV